MRCALGLHTNCFFVWTKTTTKSFLNLKWGNKYPTTKNEMMHTVQTAPSDGLYHPLVEQSFAGQYAIQDGVFIYVNPRLCEILGYSREELIGCTPLEVVHPDDRELANERFKRRLENKLPERWYPYRLLRKDGKVIHVELLTRVVEYNGKPTVIGTIIDLTDRVKEERELNRINRALKLLSHYNRLVLEAKDEHTLLQEVCNIIVEIGGYWFTWVGYAEPDKSVRPIVWAGHEDGYLKSLHVRWDNSELGSGPIGTTIRTGKPTIVRQMTTDPRFVAWRDEAIRHGYWAFIALPLIIGGRIIGTLNIYTSKDEEDVFDEGELKLLSELANLLGHDIEVLNIRSEQERVERALRESEARYRSLVEDVIDTSKVGVFILDKDFRIVWLNNAIEQYFGIQREDVIGKDKRELIEEKLKHFFTEPDVFAERVLTTYDNNTYMRGFECHVVGDGHEERWLEYWSQPIKSGLYAGGRVEHYTDITELKHAQEELMRTENILRLVLEGSDTGFWDWNLVTNTVKVGHR